MVIDLDGARLAPRVGAPRRMHELMRLHRSLRKRGLLSRVGRKGLATFLEAYSQGDDELNRRLRESLPREKRREKRHALAWRLRGLPARRP